MSTGATAIDCRGLAAPDIIIKETLGDPTIVGADFHGGTEPTALLTNATGTVAFGNIPVSQKLFYVAMYLDQKLVGDAFAPIEAGVITQVQLFPHT